MLPDLLSIGPITIHTYGLCIAIGFIIGALVTVRIGRQYNMTSQQVMDMGFVLVICGMIGTRVAYILINISYYRENPLDMFKLWQGGLVFSGGLIAVILVLGWYIIKQNYSFWQLGDLWAPAAAIGQSIGRVGCFMAGCCYGRPTSYIWGITFNHPKSLAPQGISLHPTQIYASMSGLIIFITLLIIHKKKSFEGQVFLWFLILHSTSRLFVERFRGDNRGIITGYEWTMTQVVTVIILISSVSLLFMLKARHEKEIKQD